MEKVIKNKEVKNNNMGAGIENNIPKESQQPVMQQPVMQQPNKQPTAQQPVMQQPNKQPTAQQPVMQQPNKQPAVQQPVAQQPNIQPPAMQLPVMQQPNMQQPMMQLPVMQQPNMHQPMMQLPDMTGQQMMPVQFMQQVPTQMPFMGNMQGMDDYMPGPVCPLLMSMQCPMMNDQTLGGMNSMAPMGQMYQPPIYMAYPYMNPNR